MSEAEECLRLSDVRAYWDGELRGEAVEELTRHLGQCPICRDEHRESERFMALLEAGDAAEPLAEERREAMRAAVLEACVPKRTAWGWVAGLAGIASRFVDGLLFRPSGAPGSNGASSPGADAPGYPLFAPPGLPGPGAEAPQRAGTRLPVTPPGLQGLSHRAGAGRWVALGLVPVAVLLLAVWLGRLQRPGGRGTVAVQTSPGGQDRGSTPEKRVPDQKPREVVDDGGPAQAPKRELGPAIVKERGPVRGAGQRKRRVHERVAEAAPLRKTRPAEAPEFRTSPKRPPQKIRVAVNQPSRPEPVLRERLVVLAEGSVFPADFAAPTPAPRRIIAAGGESAPAGQAVIIHSNDKGERP